ncbi:HNH endonuclease signature motif containing protein [Bacillus toyonensis]|uniref:HNH endonuclease signature motif containing protein n=1 Tax=Bacillus toyonensis TaxID=155322 RepID=UPI000BF1AE88|nr:HNH endonuclease signature motif containing protein [Bacillus toyonensis]PEI49915.1 hypothetical protein CN631_15725 [Bacillus toyonensis]
MKKIYITPEEYKQAEERGITRGALYQRIHEEGMDKEEALVKPLDAGKYWMWKDIAEENGISMGIFYTRVNNYKWSERKAATTLVKKRKKLDFEEDENGCFNVISHSKKNGYAQLTMRGKNISAHRFVYEEMFGEIPPGLVIRHKCDNRKCINPEHLETGTYKDNVMDMVTRGRMRTLKGSSRRDAKLTEESVIEIRRLVKEENVSMKDLAERYGVAYGTIQNVVRRRSWKHI